MKLCTDTYIWEGIWEGSSSCGERSYSGSHSEQIWCCSCWYGWPYAGWSSGLTRICLCSSWTASFLTTLLSHWSDTFFLVNWYCQDNEPLMRALSKLINLNKPDLVLFVGEALVGNDAVDQLNKFNQVLVLQWQRGKQATCMLCFLSLLTALNSFFLEQKLADLSTVPTARLIDGILLTKFDTIDDKVGGTCAEHMLD